MQTWVKSFRQSLAGKEVHLTERGDALSYEEGVSTIQVQYAGTILNPASGKEFVVKTQRYSGRQVLLAFDTSTPQGRALLRRHRIPYLDRHGNLYLPGLDGVTRLLFEDPSVFGRVKAEGGSYTKNDLRVLYAFITQAPKSFGGSQGELARVAGVSDAAVTRALSKLEGNGYSRNREQLGVEQCEQLIRSWAEHYVNTLKPKLESRRFRPLSIAEDWRKLPLLPGYLYYSGVAAAAVEQFDIVAGSAIEVYGPLDEAMFEARSLRWIPDSEGPLICYNQFWRKPTIEWRLTGRSEHATIPLLTYADLLANKDVRASELAEQEVLPMCVKLYGRR